MDGIKEIGKLVVQAFQKLPGVSELIGTSGMETFELIGGILIVLSYILAFGCLILGIVKFSLKKISNDKNGNVNDKSPSYWLISGLVAGGILLILPSIILIIGGAMGSIANSN